MRRKFYKSERLRDIQALVRRAAVLYADNTAYQEIKPQKKVIEYSFKRLEEDVNAFGTRLLEMGMKGYHIAILGENSYAWVLSYLTIVNGVGVAVPLDKELTDEDIAKLLIKCDADAVICSGTFASVMKDILSECPNIKACIIMNFEKEHPEFPAMQKLIEDGRRLITNGHHEYTDIVIDENAVCEIVFTSGTTGANKGVMLSHKNIMTVVYGALCLIDPRGVSFSVLPINHTYECSCHILGGLYSGLNICFNDSLKRVANNMKFIKPNMSIMVPLFLESMQKNIWKEAKKNGLDKHLRYGLNYSNLIRKFGFDFRRLFFKPLLGTFGGNLEQIVCGGAPLRSEIIKELSDFGIDILNGYGITECAPLVASNTRRWSKPGSVGRVMPGCTVRIYHPDETGNGEIQVKGDNVMLGYYKEPEKTKLCFTEDGWFRTGDIGHLDKANFLYINGREKNLIILANGKNVHPEEIEDIIIEKLAYVKEVVVYAPASEDGKEGCITACVYFDEEYLMVKGINELQKRLNEDIKLLNRSLPIYKRVANVLISKSEFKKTTTKKIIRTAILEGSIENA